MPRLETVYRGFRWLRSRVRPGALVLLYHRVATPGVDPFNLCVRAEHFRQQMAALRRWASPVSLTKLLQAAESDALPPRTLAVTFDDGYADTLYNALPALAEFDIPATIFITTGNPGQPFWWDRLCAAILSAPNLPAELHLQVGDCSYNWSAATPIQRRVRRLFEETYRVCQALPMSAREEFLRTLETWSGHTASRDSCALSGDEIRKLALANLVSVGAHTVNHRNLSRLNRADQRDELQRSREDLEKLVGTRVSHMSYPFGLPGQHYTPQTVEVAREAGYCCACAAYPDVVERHTDRFQLPRYWVHDWPGDQFLEHLGRWL